MVRIDGVEVSAGPPQQRMLLAVLALRRGVVASTDELIADVWGAASPGSAVAIVQSYVHGLRQLLGKSAITSSRQGYALASADLDVAAFEEFVVAAQQAMAEGNREAAAAGLRRALGLWRGPALPDLAGPGVKRHRTALTRRRLAVQIQRIELDLLLGEHRAVASELQVLAAEHPFDEHVQELLITALYRCGRQADAIAAYHECRRLLADELGVDPGPALQDLYTRIVCADPSLSTADPAGVAATAAPRQLPRPLPIFVGRDDAMNRAETLLDKPQPVIVFAGMGGVGKTTTAVHWAHRLAERYPDGHLYADLRGYGGEPPATAGDILDGFLRALGARAPAELDARAARFRELTTGRRVLVLLDNAATAEQVRDLLPGPGDSLVVVTSRATLPGLVARNGAWVVALHPPEHDEALAVFRARVGTERTRQEPAAVRDIVELSGRLPLALSIVAARVAAQEHLPLARFAAELSSAHGTLEAFSNSDPMVDVRTVLSWSYGLLDAQTAEAFGLLCAHPGPDLTLEAAASMLALPAVRTRSVLRTLSDAALLAEHRPDRYAIHDLVRAFGREHAAQNNGNGRQAAVRRLLDHYLHTTTTAASRIFPSRRIAPPEPAAPGTLIPGLDPGAWFEAEQSALLAAFDLAEREGFDSHVWQLAWVTRDYFNRHGLWHHLQVSQNQGLAAAMRSGDAVVQGHSLWGVALADCNMGRHAEAERQLHRALGIFTAAGDRADVATTRHRIAYVLAESGDFTGALGHALRLLDSYPSGTEPERRASALNLVSDQCVRLGRFDEAIAHAREALSLAGSQGPFWHADTWETLAAAQAGLGDSTAAEVSYRRSVALYVDQSAGFPAARTLRTLGDALQRAGQHGPASQAYREAREALSTSDDPRAAQLDAELASLLTTESAAERHVRRRIGRLKGAL